MTPTTTALTDGARRLAEELGAVARTLPPAEAPSDDAVGRTMFDLPGSEDLTLTVVLSQERVQLAPSQSLVRILSRPDGRRYLGVVSGGPFAEPDSLRADSPVLLAVATRGGEYLPRFHGRLQVTLLGEELADGSLAPPRLRPLPHSPVFLLDDKETAKLLRADGDIRLGLAAGHDNVPVGIPSTSKGVLPRHTAVLGTTGAGKSTTVAGMVCEAQKAGLAVVLLDVEGEYTCLHEPADDARLKSLLAERRLHFRGVPAGKMTLYHLVGRDTTNPAHPDRRPFSLQFARLSPYTVMEMCGLNDAQTDRYLFAYELAKGLLRDLGEFPQKNAADTERQRQEKLLLRLDEFERGYPRLTLSFLLDVVKQCKASVVGTPVTPFNLKLRSPEGQQALARRMDAVTVPTNAASWGKLESLLWRLQKLRVFDRHSAGGHFLNYRDLLRPGAVSVIDLSDAGLSELSNIAVADVLRGIQEAQEAAYREFEGGKADAPPRVLLVVEEAHEFLSAERVAKTPHLFAQVARIAKRGRKRWLGLTFVTQMPQHLPREVLSLCNNFVLHKLTDPQVLHALRHTVSGIDDSLWARLPGLAPGQAIVSFGHMARPLLVSVDPAPCKLRMVE
ncbi:MAG TPA: ATP-binding protein [Gemmataceae bacterium]|nr:ATP-binding protein [Gemmataceae bacterium]